jgi:hypothetical protein
VPWLFESDAARFMAVMDPFIVFVTCLSIIFAVG